MLVVSMWAPLRCWESMAIPSTLLPAYLNVIPTVTHVNSYCISQTLVISPNLPLVNISMTSEKCLWGVDVWNLWLLAARPHLQVHVSPMSLPGCAAHTELRGWPGNTQHHLFCFRKAAPDIFLPRSCGIILSGLATCHVCLSGWWKANAMSPQCASHTGRVWSILRANRRHPMPHPIPHPLVVGGMGCPLSAFCGKFTVGWALVGCHIHRIIMLLYTIM